MFLSDKYFIIVIYFIVLIILNLERSLLYPFFGDSVIKALNLQLYSFEHMQNIPTFD